MSGAARAFAEWFDEIDGSEFTVFSQEDLAEAFTEGWNRAMGATWEPGGQPAHPGAPG